MVLPTNVDATYADSGTDASQKTHQQHHDTLHALANTYEGTAPADFAAAGDLAALDTRLDTIEGDAATLGSGAAADGLVLTTDGAGGTAWEAGGGGGGGSVATDAIFDAKGDLPVGTGADASSRLAVGPDGHVLTADSAEATGVKWAAASGGGGGGGILAAIALSGPADSVFQSAGATSLADMSASDVVVTFTVPTSGKVLVRITSVMNNTGGISYWGVREGSSVIAGPQEVQHNSTMRSIRTAEFLITGLTGGASKTYKAAHYASGGSSSYVYYGTMHQIVMTVLEVP